MGREPGDLIAASEEERIRRDKESLDLLISHHRKRGVNAAYIARSENSELQTYEATGRWHVP
jgi:hypothetical protein